ncbi:putative potassium sodium efflux p-type atpase protein [Botrytis cinerea BcDW1]|uniref:P-type Na(+) transporter n=2 Tax=Botryotinia fuckeliana TaxID=40559 RepID=G2YCJ2_BOTF4|nr:putative potassium sodium efflux p-type atpase protein [Botrytis cinerea BcDW1]CCD34821.1 similar to P-type ATPase [Botrytis cinerea T4]
MASQEKTSYTTRPHAFLLTPQDAASQLSTNLETGLTASKVQSIQASHPPNELDTGGSISWYRILIKQISNAMILVLVFAMALSFGVGDYIEGGVLVAVIVLNVMIGFFQEFSAEKKMDSLRALSSPSASVLRDGSVIVVPSAEVVPGDIVLLKTGDTVPADLRIFEAMNLTCEEKSLTGESEPVEKITSNEICVPGTEERATTEEQVGIADRNNMAYSTTTVIKGRGRGIVVFTGMQTEVGKIAASTTKKQRKEGRSMNYKKYGKAQPVKGAARRTYDFVGKFLGLTEGTPLQRKLSKVAYILFGCAILLAIVVFGVNRFNVTDEVAIYAISTGIAIIPESLIAVLTITMVVGMTVMRKANVVVRDLSALEALGGVTNICSDKTGTLTQGAMIVKKVWIPKIGIYTVNHSMDPNNPTEGTVTKAPLKSEGMQTPDSPSETEKIDFDNQRSAAALKFDIPAEKAVRDERKNPSSEQDEEPAEIIPELESFLQSAALCNLATVKHEVVEGETAKKWQTTGEPTEIALQVFTHRFESGKRAFESKGWKQTAEFPFDSSIKRMSVIYQRPDGEHIVFTKGAVERVLDLCSSVGSGNTNEIMTDELKESIIRQMNRFAEQGQRVLAVAAKPWTATVSSQDKNSNDESLRGEVEQDLTLLGLVGIYDPPRDETKDAIRECTQAGIKVHMLTGDHPSTAKAIAQEIGIIPRNLGQLSAGVSASVVMKATDFDHLTNAQIDALPTLPLVLARCAPDTKTRMIHALRRRGLYMAMTGDGVNDAPSLSEADVGIAMGIAGSDVAKSAAKMVLLDDKFNSIVSAIREGRRMFDNIQRFVLHLLSSNVGEVILLIAGLGFQDANRQSVFPLSPLQILWINMLTSSFPAFGLGKEKASSTVMRRPPHDNKRGVFTTQILVDMVVYGILMGTCTLLTFVIIIYGVNEGNLGSDCNRSYGPNCGPVFRARATVFAELTWLILISAWEFKSIRRSMFRLDATSESSFPFFKDVYENRFLFWAVVIGALSVFPAVYIPGLNTSVFKHVGITWEWSLAVGAVFVFVLGIEAWKASKRYFGLFEQLDEEEAERDRKLGLRQGFFTFAKSTTSVGRSSMDQYSVKEKIAGMGSLGSAPTTRSMLQKESRVETGLSGDSAV